PDGGDNAGEVDGGLAESILAAEQAIARSAWRPDGLASPYKARMYMLQGARRIAGLIEVFHRLPVRSVAGLEDVSSHLIDELASELDRCAGGVASYGRVLPEPGRIEQVKDRFTAAGHRRFTDDLAGGQEPDGLRSFAAWYFVLQQLSWGASLASIHCRAMHNAPLEASVRSEQSTLVQTLVDGPSMAKWIRRARRNLSLRSVHLQNSLRLAAGLALARLAVGILGLQHGFWVGFATLVVLKTSAAGTRSTAVQAAVGTAIGFAVSGVLITTFGVDALIYSIVLPVVVFAAFYLPGAVSFVAGQAFFTMVIVVLFNLLKPAGWTVGLIRLEDVLVGAAIGLSIGVVIWPRGASSELSRVVGRLFSTGGGYAQATVVRVLGLSPGSPGPGSAGPGTAGVKWWRDQVFVAAVDAEDVFSQYLSEPHQSDAPVLAWASLMATAHQLWFGSSVVGLVPEATGAAIRMPEVCDRLLSSSAALAQDYRRLAGSLGGQDRWEMTEPLTVGGSIDRSLPDATITLLQLEAWLAELSVEIARTHPALDELGFGTGAVPAVPSPARR
ncbi:MAG: FUSC family protein, partial [Acidimicrobiales bacterium]